MFLLQVTQSWYKIGLISMSKVTKVYDVRQDLTAFNASSLLKTNINYGNKESI